MSAREETWCVQRSRPDQHSLPGTVLIVKGTVMTCIWLLCLWNSYHLIISYIKMCRHTRTLHICIYCIYIYVYTPNEDVYITRYIHTHTQTVYCEYISNVATLSKCTSWFSSLFSVILFSVLGLAQLFKSARPWRGSSGVTGLHCFWNPKTLKTTTS